MPTDSDADKDTIHCTFPTPTAVSHIIAKRRKKTLVAKKHICHEWLNNAFTSNQTENCCYKHINKRVGNNHNNMRCWIIQ